LMSLSFLFLVLSDLERGPSHVCMANGKDYGRKFPRMENAAAVSTTPD
jgi:hypothetical protein